MGNKKVFVLGLDGATFDLILPWVSEGKLPAFSRLIAEDAWGELESVPNQRSAAAWTSFMTGKNPGKHGIFEFYEYLPSTYSLRFINAKHREGKSLWQILNQSNKAVGVMNVPMTYPAEEVHGFIIAGLDSPSVKSKGFTYPPSLYDTLCRKFGEYILEPGLTGAIVGGKIDEAVEMIKRELSNKMDVCRYLIANYPWDFFMVVLRSLDAVQHCFWKYMDTTHRDFNLAESRLYGGIILSTYQMIDGFLEELMASLDDDTTLLLMSDHGFGQKHPATNQLNQWIESTGLLAYKKSPEKGTTRVLGSVYRGIIGKTPRKAKEWLWETFPSLRDSIQSRLCFANIEWSKTAAYSDSLFPNIHINLKGRELHGIVRPGKEYEELVNRLISELKDLRDSGTGERIVEAVFRREEIYHGKYVHRAPDLLMRWREDTTISGIKVNNHSHSLKSAAPLIPGEDYRVISGDHHLKGIFLAHGSDIKKRTRIKGANIVDLAPTILYQMGVPIPGDMDGKVLSPIFEERFLKTNPLSYDLNNVAGREPFSCKSEEYTPEEAQEIENRLRGLGYIE